MSQDFSLNCNGQSIEIIVDTGVGPQGSQGYSAYEIAVFNGFDGTEEQWLQSLKGLDGLPSDAEGSVLRVIVNDFIPVNRFLILDNDQTYKLANALNLDHMHKVIGIAENSAAPGQECRIRYAGTRFEAMWNWEINKPLFLSENGNMTQDPPQSGFIQIIATPILPTTILINIQEPIKLL